jgi:hypothetical protein
MGRCRTLKQTYQDLYDHTDYGKAEKGNCPTVYLYDHYKGFLKGGIIELGCGRGDGVHFLIDKGFDCDGYDQINLYNGMGVKDITKRMDLSDYTTSICIDVFEHILDKQLIGLLKNMRTTKRQIISVHNKPSAFRDANGDNLHINIKDFVDWDKFISVYLDIVSITKVNDYLRMYFCEN